MVPNQRLKIFNFKTGKPQVSPSDRLADWTRRLLEISQRMHENTITSGANWMITGQRVADEIAALTSDETQTLGRTRILDVDTVDNDPTQLSVRMTYEPTRAINFVNINTTITSSGDNIILSG